jgi:hypothetical protein
VEGLRADLGGTELLAPLEAIFASAVISGYTRQVFVLTDGEVSNTAALIAAVARGHAHTHTRVFALGLGHGASRELVSGIARAGKGTSDFVLEEDRLNATVVAQLKQAVQPALVDVTVEWEGMAATPAAQSVAASVAGAIGSLLGFKKPAAAPLLDAQSFLQAPFTVPPVFSGTRFLVFCLLRPGSTPPTAVTVKANTPDGPLAVRLEVPPIEPAPRLVFLVYNQPRTYLAMACMPCMSCTYAVDRPAGARRRHHARRRRHPHHGCARPAARLRRRHVLSP